MEDITSTTEHKRLAVVTGGNKGIGFEICRQLASSGIRVILTARDENKGTEAIEKLNKSGLTDVVFHQLDVKDPASIASLAKFIETNFKRLDILVNNAGALGVIRNDEAFRAFKYSTGYKVVTDNNAHLLNGIVHQTYETAEECFITNYYGTKRVTKELLPLLQLSNSARIVNLSSLYGQLKWIHNDEVKEELGNLESLTEDKIEQILHWYLRDFKESKLKENGWPIISSAYKVSKACVTAYTRLTARKFPDMLVNCVHPGYAITDITANTGFLTPEEGARAPVMLVLLPDGGPSGLYFNEMNVDTF